MHRSGLAALSHNPPLRTLLQTEWLIFVNIEICYVCLPTLSSLSSLILGEVSATKHCGAAHRIQVLRLASVLDIMRSPQNGIDLICGRNTDHTLIHHANWAEGKRTNIRLSRLRLSRNSGVAIVGLDSLAKLVH